MEIIQIGVIHISASLKMMRTNPKNKLVPAFLRTKFKLSFKIKQNQLNKNII